jgi:hypothetical protein
MKIDRIFIIGMTTLVVAGLVTAFYTLGTPAHQRALALDERRVDDLRAMNSIIQRRYDGSALPSRLPNDIEQTDPSTSQAYAYVRLGKQDYKLCANFALAASDDAWSHGAGRTCFQRRLRVYSQAN